MDLPLLPLLLVLLVALAAGRIAFRFGFPSVLGELIAGIVLGPPLLGLLSGHPALDVLAQLGIILMMLYIGMEIDPAEMKKASTAGFLAAIGGFITPFVLCYLLIVGVGGTPLAGMFVGMAAGVTSLATKSRILSDLRLLDTRIAHVMMAGALIADTLSLILFAGIIGVAEAGSLQISDLALALAKAFAFFVLAWVVGRVAIPPIGKMLRNTGRGVTFASVVAITLVYAEGAHLAGMHGILGAFLAGLLLRDSVLGKTLKTEVMDLVRDTSVGFLAPVFFVTAGFAVSLDVVTERPLLLLAVVGLASVGKVIGTALFYLPTGHGWREGLVIGASMNGRGAVEIIIAQIGLSMGLITAEIFSILVFMAIATTATVPLFLKWGTDWLKSRGELVRSSTDRSGTVVLGASPTALAVAGAISPEVTLIDRNQEHVRLARAAGHRVVQGDALDERVLAEAGLSTAAHFIALTGNTEVDVLAARMARSTFLVPDILLPAYGSQSEAHREARAYLDAHTLFGGAIAPDQWNALLGAGSVDTDVQEVDHETSLGELAGRLRDVASILPLAVEHRGERLPAHAGLTLKPGDRLHFLRAQRSGLTSPLIPQMLSRAPVVDIDASSNFEEFLALVASALAPEVGESAEDIVAWVADREHRSSTVIEAGVAIPHVRLSGPGHAGLVLARSRAGVAFPGEAHPVHAAFVIATSDDRRTDHLKLLSAIARIVGQDGFLAQWNAAGDTDSLRSLMSSRWASVTSPSLVS